MNDLEATPSGRFSSYVGQTFFYGLPLIWFAVIVILLCFSPTQAHTEETRRIVQILANVVFFGTTHAGATFYFLFGDARGKEWWGHLNAERRRRILALSIGMAIVCLLVFFISYQMKIDPFRFVVFLNLWTAWHAFRQSESLLFTIDRNPRNQKILHLFRTVLLAFGFFLLVFGKLGGSTLIWVITCSFVVMNSVVAWRCAHSGNFKSLLFSVRFYLWALQFAEPLFGLGTFAVHGVEYIYIKEQILEKTRIKFFLFMAATTCLFLLAFFQKDLRYGYLVLPIFYFTNALHYITDRFIFQYRYTFERDQILGRITL